MLKIKMVFEEYVELIKRDIRDILDDIAEDVFGWEKTPPLVIWIKGQDNEIQRAENIDEGMPGVQNVHAGRDIREQRCGGSETAYLPELPLPGD